MHLLSLPAYLILVHKRKVINVEYMVRHLFFFFFLGNKSIVNTLKFLYVLRYFDLRL